MQADSKTGNTPVKVKSEFALIEKVIKEYHNGILEQKIIDLREQDSKLQWDLGDLALGVYAACIEKNVRIQMVQAAAHIHWRMKGSYLERQPKTIEGYMSVCLFFPSQEQDEINFKRTRQHLERTGARDVYSVLPFANFALAKRTGDRWEKVLKKAVDLADKNNGEPKSVSYLEKLFFPTQSGNSPAVPEPSYVQDGKWEDHMEEQSEFPLEENYTPTGDSITVFSALSTTIKKVVGQLISEHPSLKNDGKQLQDMLDDFVAKLG